MPQYSNHESQKKTKKKGHEKILEEIIVENLPKMGKEMASQVQKTQNPKQNKPKAKHPRHILIKFTKIKHRENIKGRRKKQQITRKGIHIRIPANLSIIETLQARREWQNILKVLKEKNLQSRLLYLARISFKYEGKIKSFTDKQKLREFSITKPALQQILKDLLYTRNTEKALQNRTQNKKVHCNGIILINNYLKYKWVECPN